MSSAAAQICKISEWNFPREVVHRGERCPFLLSSSMLGRPVSEQELTAFYDDDLNECWRVASSFDLFKDEKYGQWGLHILSPEESIRKTLAERAARSESFRESDMIIGTFYGDSDLLIMTNADIANTNHQILVALPLYERENWPKVAENFSDFLKNYFQSEGDKYWEARS